MKVKFRAVDLPAIAGFDPFGYDVLVDGYRIGTVRRYYDGTRVDGWWASVGHSILASSRRTRREAADWLVNYVNYVGGDGS